MKMRVEKTIAVAVWIWGSLLWAFAGLASSHDGRDEHHGRDKAAKTLYIWAGDQARAAPDFLAVINFDEDSRNYGKVIKTVPVPPPGNVGNEPHHCHLSVDENILACGGLLSLLRGQNGIFFFDVSHPRDPKFLFSTSAPLSSITDDFLPLDTGGFLVTQMGSATGGAPGRLAEFDNGLQLYKEWPDNPPQDGFNPHGISARPEINLMVTSDFILPASTLECRSRRPGAARRDSRVGLQRTDDRAHRRDSRRPRHHGRQADSGRSVGARLHRRHVRWSRLSGGHGRGHRQGRLRLRDHRPAHRSARAWRHDAAARDASNQAIA